MRRFELLCAKHNVLIRRKPLQWDVVMTTFPCWIGGRATTISVDERLSDEVAVLGVAMMFAVLEMEWPGESFRFRFPIPEDGPIARRQHLLRIRDFRLPTRWARTFLVPDHCLAQLARGGYMDGHALARELGVGVDIVGYRAREYAARHAGLTPFFAL